MAALSSLYVELVSTAKGFSVGFDQASKDVNAFKQQTESLNTVLGKESAAAAQTTAMNMGLVASAVIGAVTAVGTTLVAMANHTAEFGEKLTDMAGRTGISVEELQKLGFAAEQSGSTMDAFANGLERISRNAYLAAGGSREQADVFKALGISVKDTNGNLKSASDLTLEVADRFHSMRGETEKTAIAIALYGRSGADLVPTLNLGSAGIRDLGDELESVSGVMSGKAVEAGDVYRDKLNLLTKATGAAGDQIGFYLIPKLIDLLDVITPLIRPTVTFVDTLLKLGTGNFLGALKNLRPPTAEEMELEKTRQAFLAFRTAAIESAEAQKLPAPIIDKHREAREKLSDAQKAANRIMEQERDEINKQGIALMNAEAAWMQYNDTMASTPIDVLRRFHTEMDSIAVSADAVAKIMRDNPSMLRPPVLPGGALEMPPLAPAVLGNGEPRTTEQWLKKWEEDAKRAAEETRKLAEATKEVERAAGKVFDAIFLGKGQPFNLQSVVTAIEGLGISLGRSMFQSIAGQLFGPLKKGFDDFFAGLLKSIGVSDLLKGLGKKLSDVFKEKGLDTAINTATGTAVQTATQAGTQAAGAASQAAGAAASAGITGTVGAVSAAVGAVAGVGVLFELMRIEGTMNAVEHNTRYSMIHNQVMIDSFFAPWTSIFEWSLNWAHESAMILDAIYNVLAGGAAIGGVPMAVGGATTNITVNISNAADLRAFADYLDGLLSTGQGGYRERWALWLNQNAGVISTVPAG